MLVESKHQLQVHLDRAETVSAFPVRFINEAALFVLAKRTFLGSASVRKPYLVEAHLKNNQLRGAAAQSSPIKLDSASHFVTGGTFLIDPYCMFAQELIARFSEQNNLDPHQLTANYLFYHEWKHQWLIVGGHRPSSIIDEVIEQRCDDFAEEEIGKAISGEAQLVIQ